MRSSRPCHRRFSQIIGLLVSLIMLLGSVLPTAAQSLSAEWALFDVPDTADFMAGYSPESEQALVLIPAETASFVVCADTPPEQV